LKILLPSDLNPSTIHFYPIRSIVSAMLISHDIVFFSHNKTASAGLQATKTIKRTWCLVLLANINIHSNGLRLRDLFSDHVMCFNESNLEAYCYNSYRHRRFRGLSLNVFCVPIYFGIELIRTMPEHITCSRVKNSS
jgi:hypothetical protein